MIRPMRAALAAALLFPAALAAQARPEPARARVAASPTQAQAQAWMAELQQIQARLQVAHNRVMQDPQLRQRQETFYHEMQQRMLRVDPGLNQLAGRVQALQAEGATALQRGDRARLMQLNTELGQIQQRFTRAQEAVLQQPDMKTRAQQLDDVLHARLVQVEPQTDRLLDRGKELQGMLIRLAQAQGAATPRN
jgi:Zn-dependent oligopeptidase